MRRSFLLALSSVVFLLVPAATWADPEAFPRPVALQPRIAFWTRIYSEIDSSGGLLHDADHLDVVYEVIRFPAGLSRRQRQHRVRQVRNHYRNLLRRLARKGRRGLSAEERRVLELWGEGVSRATLSRAARNIRFQLGQADKFRAGLARAGRWEEAIRRLLRSEGLPDELAALPHVESSYDPRAVSKAGAAGLWQFTRSTGRRFLRIDGVIDERFDPLRATEAAAVLLRENHEKTGSWPLAITAYNHGANGVLRAVRRLGTRDIGEIVTRYRSRRFGFASRNFYCEFLAALDVERRAEQLFGRIERERPEPSEVVVLDAFYPVSQLARVFGVDLGVLRLLNPALREAVWEGEKYVPRGFALRLPRVSDRPPLPQLLASVPPSARHSRQLPDRIYRVRRGDTLSAIARRFGVRESELVALNGLRSRHRIYAGQRLRLPTRRGRRAQRLARARAAAGRPSSYRVRRGDTLWGIARRFGLSARALAAANGLRDADRLRAGRVLRLPSRSEARTLASVPKAPPPVIAPGAWRGSYRVRRGDTLSAIARRVGVSTRELARANGLLRPDRLRVGQTLRIPESQAKSGAQPAAAPRLASLRESERAPAQPTATEPAGARPTGAQASDPSGREPAAKQAARQPASVAAPSEPPEPFAMPSGERLAVAPDGTIRALPEETLGHYADWLEIPTQRLRRVNGLRGSALAVGQRVRLDFSRVAPERFTARRMAFHRELRTRFFARHRVRGWRRHVLRRGETLWELCRHRYGIPLWLLTDANPEVDFGALRTGTRLRIPEVEPRSS